MNLKQFATTMASNGNFVKASFGGFAGSGKTRTAAELLVGVYRDFGYKKPILLIDNEHGSRFLIPFFKKELPGVEVVVKNTTSLPDVIESMKFLTTGEVDALFIDSLSKVWYKYVAEYKAKNRLAFMTLQDWGKILPSWQQEFSDRFVDVAGTIVFTGRGGFSYEKEEDETDANGKVKKGQFVKSGVKMKMAGETPFEPDLNVWMEQQQEMGTDGKVAKVTREAHIMKDRSGQIDGMTFVNPTYKNFKPFVKFLIGLPVGEVAGTSNEANIAPAENYEGWDRKQKREIEMEKIGGLFDKYGYSGSLTKDQKQIKAEIIEKIFRTLSMTEIEKFEPSVLAEKAGNLSVLLKEISTEDNKLEAIKNFKLPDEAFNEMMAER